MKDFLNKSSNKTREAQFAGKFYPLKKEELKGELNQLFNGAQPLLHPNQNLQALISPHAGYIYSGSVAASAFNQMPENKTYQRIFILASSHQFSFNGAAVYAEGNYQTPLGTITTDIKLANRLVQNNSVFSLNSEAHQFEHSLEVQLPFIQKKLGNNFRLVPIIIGTTNYSVCKKIAEALLPFFTPKNLFVISTDFSHYPTYENAKLLDQKTADSICSNQAEKLLNTLEQNKQLSIKNLATSLCGWSSVLTLLYLTENNNYTFKQIDYKNSGDAAVYTSKNQVVGYWAISVYSPSFHFEISEKEKAIILEKARNSIHNFVQSSHEKQKIKDETTEILNQKTGVFVSIYINNELRGCIGGFPQEKTLNELIQEMAVSAACDRRFDRLTPNELENMELEISVISPLKKIKSVEEIELGKHGIYIKNGLHTGTFLPQVATKTGWNIEQCLGHCSRDKAGLGWEGWKTAELFIYEAIIFKG